VAVHQIVIVLITQHVKIENVSILVLKKILVQEMLIAKLFDTSQFVLVLTVTLEIQQPLVNCLPDQNVLLIQNALITLHVSEKNA
jgi:hypothetical protein